jgi:hypothetical protein
MNGKHKSTQPAERNRRNKSLSQLTRSLLGPIFRKQGFARQEIVTRWEAIVGESLGQYTQPERISFPRNARQGGTLFVRVEGAFALELQHRSPEILERLNTYFGYGAVEKIVIHQGPLANKKNKRKDESLPLSDTEQAKLDDTVMATKDDRLKNALRNIGQHVLTTNHSPGQQAEQTRTPAKPGKDNN